MTPSYDVLVVGGGATGAGLVRDLGMRGLRSLGYTCENLEGGVADWHRAGLPLEAEGGGPGRVI